MPENCGTCEFYQECPESCIDCWCAACTRHGWNDNCGLDLADQYTLKEADDA